MHIQLKQHFGKEKNQDTTDRARQAVKLGVYVLSENPTMWNNLLYTVLGKSTCLFPML